MLGERRNTGNDWDRWNSIFIPSEPSYELPSGMDAPCAFSVGIEAGLDFNDSVTTTFKLIDGIMTDPADPNDIAWLLVSGRYYDAVNNFGSYPQGRWLKGSNYQVLTIADLPIIYTLWYPPGLANTYKESLFRNGYVIGSGTWVPTDPSAWANNKECKISIKPRLIHIQYLNSVVNSMSLDHVPTTAGTSLVLSGMGFNNTDADIKGGWPTVAVTTDRLDNIYFEGRQGQGTYIYTYA
ncbi:unnamed protein product, partial [marine sediment metagenome]